MREFKVKDLMSTDVLTLDEEENLNVAESIMELAHIRHLPVLRGKELVGLVTHRDILKAQVSILAQLTRNEDEDTKSWIRCQDIMTRDIRSVDPDMPAVEAAKTLMRNKFGCLPVVQDGEVVGIITESDFVEWALQAMELAAKQTSLVENIST